MLAAFYLPILQPAEIKDNLAWDEYFSLHLLEHAPVPTTVVDFVTCRQRGPFPDSGPPQQEWVLDSFGRSPLHVATRHNFVSVVKYLVEVGGINPDLLDAHGMSALAIAFDLQYRVMWDYLTSIGARSYRFGEPETPEGEAGQVEELVEEPATVRDEAEGTASEAGQVEESALVLDAAEGHVGEAGQVEEPATVLDAAEGHAGEA